MEMRKTCLDFSMAFECSEIGTGEWNRTLFVTSPERDTLARNLGLVKLTSLVVEIGLKRNPGRNEIFDLRGELSASVLQECVICLGSVSADIKEELYGQFVPEALLNVKEDIFWHADPDHPETYSNDLLELGKLIQDQLSVAIDPYPRHDHGSGGEQCIIMADETDGSGRIGRFPFRDLGNLLNKKKKKVRE